MIALLSFIVMKLRIGLVILNLLSTGPLDLLTLSGIEYLPVIHQQQTFIEGLSFSLTPWIFSFKDIFIFCKSEWLLSLHCSSIVYRACSIILGLSSTCLCNRSNHQCFLLDLILTYSQETAQIHGLFLWLYWFPF